MKLKQKLISGIKDIIKLTIFYFVDLLIKPPKQIRENSLLLIRLDAIGDYILFRNFIEVLRKSEKYKNNLITFVGNIAWKTLAEELDREYIDEFIWVDRIKFTRNLFYRYKKLKEITSKGYEVVLNPVYSREFWFGDNIVKLVTAKEKIGSIGDLSNIKKWQKKISDKYYTRLIPAKEEIMFEFYRNREFFENLLETKINISKPEIKIKQKKPNFKLPKNYALLFIGGGANFRKWNIQNFAKTGEYLKKRYGYDIVLSGGPNDIQDAKNFEKYANYEYVDLVGKTSLIDLLYIVSNANLIISNETMVPHLAVALDKKNIFVISNGNHFGRFTPYPKEITNGYYVIYHPEIEKDLENYKRLSNTYGYGSRLDINEITFEMVWDRITKVLR